MHIRIVQIVALMAVPLLSGCVSQKYYDKPSTPFAQPTRIVNNTRVLLDIRYAGKLVRARLSPNDSFDLFPGTWGTPHTYTVVAVGFDASGKFVGTATRQFSFTPSQMTLGEAINKSLEAEGITAGRKEITIEDLNPIKILRKVGSTAKGLNPKSVFHQMQSSKPMETWSVTTLTGPGLR